MSISEFHAYVVEEYGVEGYVTRGIFRTLPEAVEYVECVQEVEGHGPYRWTITHWETIDHEVVAEWEFDNDSCAWGRTK